MEPALCVGSGSPADNQDTMTPTIGFGRVPSFLCRAWPGPHPSRLGLSDPQTIPRFGPDACSPQGRDRVGWTPWRPGWRGLGVDALILVVLLGVLGWPVFVNRDARDPGRIMENLSIGSAQETWLAESGGVYGFEASELPGRVPTWGGGPRVRKPPMLVWLSNAALVGLEPGVASVEEVVSRYRWVAGVLALLAVVATYWAGRTLQGPWLGLLACALLLSMAWFFMKMARTASYDTHILGWCTLAVASGLWAMNPTRRTWARENVDPDPDPGRCRRLAGWSLSALALTMGIWSKGPVVLPLVMVPLVLAFAFMPARRQWGDLAAVLGVGAIACASFFPVWWPWVASVQSDAGQMALREYTAERGADGYNPWWYYVGLIGLVVPWSLALLGGLALPWVRMQDRGRRVALMPWLWLVGIVVVLSLSGAKQQRYILPALPAVGLVCAQVMIDHLRMQRAGRRIWLQSALSLGTGFMASAMIVLIAVALLRQPTGPWPMDEGVEPYMANMPVLGGLLLLGVALLIALGSGWRWVRGRHLTGPLGLAVAVGLSSGLYWSGYAESRAVINAVPATVAALRDRVGDDRLFYLQLPDRQGIVDQEGLLIYLRRPVPNRTPELLASAEHRPTWILSDPKPEDRELLLGLGYGRALVVEVERSNQLWLWRQGGDDTPELVVRPKNLDKAKAKLNADESG